MPGAVAALVELGQVRPWAHSVSRVPKNRSILPFQLWCGGRSEDVAGAELGERVAEHVRARVALRVVRHHRHCRRSPARRTRWARRRVAETFAAFSRTAPDLATAPAPRARHPARPTQPLGHLRLSPAGSSDGPAHARTLRGTEGRVARSPVAAGRSRGRVDTGPRPRPRRRTIRREANMCSHTSYEGRTGCPVT